MTISVIIAHRNDRDALEDTISSLGDKPEITVVDDASSFDQDPFHIDWINHRCQVLHQRQQHGVGRSRNAGALKSESDLLVFTDSHMIFPEGWADQIVKTFKAARQNDSPYGSQSLLLCSAYVSDHPIPGLPEQARMCSGAGLHHLAVERSRYNICHLTPRNYAVGVSAVPGVIGACYVIERDYFMSLGGFDGLDGYGGDEQLLSWKVWMSGGVVMCDGDLLVTHLDQGHKNLKYDPNLYLRNKLFVQRVVMGTNNFTKFVCSLPAWVLPQAHMVLAAPMPVFEVTIHPDDISHNFNLQTIAEAIDLAGRMDITPSVEITNG